MNRVIITDKGIQVSKEIKSELSSQPTNSSRKPYENATSYIAQPFEKQSAALTKSNYPSGFHAQLQSKISVSLMQSPFRSTFYSGNATNGNYNRSSNFLKTGYGVPGQSGTNSLANLHLDGVLSELYAKPDKQSHAHETSFFKSGGGVGGRSSLQLQPDSILGSGRMNNNSNHRTAAAFGSTTGLLSYRSAAHSAGSSTQQAVNNRKVLENKVEVQSLGGLKLSMMNLNFKNEQDAQNAQQKEQIQTVQQERLAKKYHDWNEQYLRSKTLMKEKYSQKYEDMTKLGDKEDEDLFWKQWHTMKQSCDDNLNGVEKQNARYEERVIRKLNKKYKSAFKNLPACAKQPESRVSLPSLQPKK